MATNKSWFHKLISTQLLLSNPHTKGLCGRDNFDRHYLLNGHKIKKRHFLKLLSFAHHEVSRQQFLQKLCLFVLHGLDDELIVAGDVEKGAARARIRELNQGVVTQGILLPKQKENRNQFKNKHADRQHEGQTAPGGED